MCAARPRVRRAVRRCASTAAWSARFRKSGPYSVTVVRPNPDEGFRHLRLSNTIHRELGGEARTAGHEGRAYLFVDMAPQHGQDLGTRELHHLLRDWIARNCEC